MGQLIDNMTDNGFNDLSSVTRYLESRRSGRPRDMIAPGPNAEEIRDIIASAIRTPDHGKLAPWRVVSVAAHQRDMLAQGINAAYKAEKPDAGRLELEALENMAREAPALLIVLYSPQHSSKIPEWEQQLSCGAFCMNILHAVQVRGYVGGWLTGWPSYNDSVRDLFGRAPERIAAFIFIGSSGGPLKERPRPDVDTILSPWEGTKTGKDN